ncbi:subtilisin-like protein [Trichoderma asperelloides]|nr:subtilisin-like protein [Trichoderma asperelloides]
MEGDDFDPDAGDNELFDTQTKGGQSYEERLEAAVEAIIAKKYFTQEGDVDEFFSQHGDVAGKSLASRNLLHELVDKITHKLIELENVKPLVQRLVEIHPDLLTVPNKDGYNPIHQALKTSNEQKSNHQLAGYMIFACLNNNRGTSDPHLMQYLQEALQKRENNRTCLHTAFMENLDPSIIRLLIENSSDEALAVQDADGKTPMHHAVLFKQCTDARAELIAMLIKRDLIILQSMPTFKKTFLDYSSKMGCSVFQEHQATRDEVPAQERLQKNKNNAITEKNNINVWKKNSKDIMLALKLHYMKTRDSEMARSFLYGTNLDDVQISFDYDGLPLRIKWKDFTERFGANEKSGIKFDTVLQYVSFSNVEVELTGRRADLEREAARESKMNQLGPLGREDMKYFFQWLHKKGVRHIIKVSVQDSGDKVHCDQAIQESLEPFVIDRLDWQKTDLDPETILHASSKALVNADDPNNVEKMLPDRQLKELWLRWSGNNAILRAWSEPEGRPRLAQLQTIHLFRPPFEKVCDEDDLLWVNQKVEEFKVRLNKNFREARNREVSSSENGVSLEPATRREINVKLYDDASKNQENNAVSRGMSHSTTAPVQGANLHKWLDSTSRFATEMAHYWEATLEDFTKSRKNQGTAERVEEDVVVALIDDGVDRFDVDSKQILEGKSFDFHDGKVKQPFTSARGHGTVMARMILRVCPMAKIYPIRLKMYSNSDGKIQIDGRYAAQAIEAALTKKATIISMSWTLPMNKDNIEVKHRPINDNVLMFCSSPDAGKFTQYDYPSGPWGHKHFFRIGAARADGNVFEWTDEAGIAFVLPGVEVVNDQANSNIYHAESKVTSDNAAKIKYETGSSVATALAAGLAAMIIYCVKASILALKTANQNKGQVVGIAIPDNAAGMIAKHEAMKRAFTCLGEVTPNKFIQVWEELDKISSMLKSRTGDLTPELKLERTNQFVQFGSRLASSIQSDGIKRGL